MNIKEIELHVITELYNQLDCYTVGYLEFVKLVFPTTAGLLEDDREFSTTLEAMKAALSIEGHGMSLSCAIHIIEHFKKDQFIILTGLNNGKILLLEEGISPSENKYIYISPHGDIFSQKADWDEYQYQQLSIFGEIEC